MVNIPTFPDFARVNKTICQEVNAFTREYPPYSDFNFVSLVSWGSNDSARVSLLNDNLVLRMPDYTDDTEVFSVLGTNTMEATAGTLLDTAEQHTGMRALKLVPEIGAQALEHSGLFNAQEDPDNHDYVLSLADITAKFGSRFRNMRREINHFMTAYGDQVSFRELDIGDLQVQTAIVHVFLGREQAKAANGHENDPEPELAAIGRLFAHADMLDLVSFGVEIAGALKAFIICEKVDAEWCIGHFWKADTTYGGIYRYFMDQVAQRLHAEGYSKMNIEQDLGIAGLRRMKQLFNPVGQLKKYTITDK